MLSRCNLTESSDSQEKPKKQKPKEVSKGTRKGDETGNRSKGKSKDDKQSQKKRDEDDVDGDAPQSKSKKSKKKKEDEEDDDGDGMFDVMGDRRGDDEDGEDDVMGGMQVRGRKTKKRPSASATDKTKTKKEKTSRKGTKTKGSKRNNSAATGSKSSCSTSDNELGGLKKEAMKAIQRAEMAEQHAHPNQCIQLSQEWKTYQKHSCQIVQSHSILHCSHNLQEEEDHKDSQDGCTSLTEAGHI